MKILLDMNVPLKFLDLLTNKGIEALRWSDVGLPGAPDVEIVAYAKENEYIILTYDLDFSTILSITHDLKPSIIQIRTSVRDAQIAVDLIASALTMYESEMKKGSIMSINIKKARLRLLPL